MVDAAGPSMPALSLWQPWASLIAHRIKTIETRSWPAPKALIGGRIAIAATASAPRPIPGVGSGGRSDITYANAAGRPAGVAQGERVTTHTFKPYGGELIRLPLGVIVASAVVADCVPTDKIGWSGLLPEWAGWNYQTSNGRPVRAVAGPDTNPGLRRWPDVYAVAGIDQRPYGDYTPGRWAWLLDDIKATEQRCPWCWGRKATPDRIEGGSASCGHCNRTLTFNFMRDGTPECDCVEARKDRACTFCGGTGVCAPIAVRGRQRVWRWRP